MWLGYILARVKRIFQKGAQQAIQDQPSILHAKSLTLHQREIRQRCEVPHYLKRYNEERKRKDLAERIYLQVPYVEKDTAKSLGARWDPQKKQWYVPSNYDVQKVEKWLPASIVIRRAKEGKTLTIELVPSSCWFSNVRSHVSQSEWRKVQQYTFRKAGYKCEICGGQGEKHPVECHEIWDYDDTKYLQILRGTISLCPKCHMVKHLGFATLNGRGKQAEQWLAQINRWSKEQATAYVKAAFETWDARSQVTWTLDLDWLNQTFDFDVKAQR